MGKTLRDFVMILQELTCKHVLRGMETIDIVRLT